MKVLFAKAMMALVFATVALSLAGEEPVINVDFTKEQGGISKYVYGQFIEQMGRCIYGGIWAEMLEDRKFFYPVGSKESPWKLHEEGEGFKVTMDEGNPYVGKWTPVLSLKESDRQWHGIVHGGLGLIEGRAYLGRIVFKVEGEVKRVGLGLRWGEGPTDRDILAIRDVSGEYIKFPFRFTAKKTTDDGEFLVGLGERGKLYVAAVSLMPANNVQGMRSDTLQLIKQLNSPIYRWPGGNFVSGYNWKDAIGDPDKRPPRKNPAWEGIEHNDFGIDEFMTFCRLANTEPLVVVNSGQGDVRLALDELEYCNGSPDSKWGKVRAENGHPEPYNLKWWGIGNEMYGDWQLGHIPVEEYAKKHNEFAEKMRAMDPSIKLVAVGNVGRWDEVMLSRCAEHMDYLSEHFYVGQKPNLTEHVVQARDQVSRIVAAVRKYHETIPALKGKTIPIALDEYNYWGGRRIYGLAGVRFQLRDGIGIALALHEMIRSNDILSMANMAQTVNVLGAIKTTKTHAAFDTVALPLVMYRSNFGCVRVKAEAAWPLDAVASLSDDRKTAYIGIVNTSTEPTKVSIKTDGLGKVKGVRRFVMTGPDENSFNEPGKPPAVLIREDVLAAWPGSDTLDKVSLTIFALSRE